MAAVSAAANLSGTGTVQRSAVGGRFVTFDAMRGIAAICVMLLHAGDLSPIAIPGGYLAVDLFLVLSGFVISRAYGVKMGQLRVGGFMRLRFIRLYPLYFCGLIFGTIVLALQSLIKGTPLPWSLIAAGLFLLPSPSGASYLYPLNPPAWSLGFEAIVNFFYALLGGKGSALLGLVLLVLSAGVIVRSGIEAGHMNLGADWASAWVGLARGVFSFTAGVLLFKIVERALFVRRTSLWSPVIAAALVAALALDFESRAMWDLVCILLLFPALVLAGSLVEPHFATPGKFLGDASYALYCIHYPLLIIGRAVIGKAGIDPVLGGTALLVAILGLAFALHRWFDEPVRRMLAYRIGRPKLSLNSNPLL